MPTYKRYVARDGQRILFFSSKPKSWNGLYWIDHYGYKYRVMGITAVEAASYTEFMELPEGKLVEVEVRVKMLNR